MDVNRQDAIVTLTRAEADALLDPAKATSEMLTDARRERMGLPPFASLLDRLERVASDLYDEADRTALVYVDEGDDFERLGYFGWNGFVWTAERFKVLKTVGTEES